MVSINYKAVYVLFLCAAAGSMLAMDNEKEIGESIAIFAKSQINNDKGSKIKKRKPYKKKIEAYKDDKVFEMMAVKMLKNCPFPFCKNKQFTGRSELKKHLMLHLSRDDKAKYLQKLRSNYEFNELGQKMFKIAKSVDLDGFFDTTKLDFNPMEKRTVLNLDEYGLNEPNCFNYSNNTAEAIIFVNSLFN